jgi:putative MATE family efflux protein
MTIWTKENFKRILIMNDTKKLEQEKISKLLVEFSIPTVVGMLVTGLYNVIDRIFIGNSVGPIGIAGVTVGFPIMVMQLAFGLLIGVGGVSLVSIKLGEQKKAEAEKIMGNTFILLSITSLLITLLGLIFLDPMIKAFGASNEVAPYAKDFLRIVLLGTFFMSTSFGMNHFIRAEGKPAKAMFTMLVGAVLNCILAPVFLFIFKWGMSGAAIATVVSQGVSCLLILSHFLRKKSFLELKYKNLKLKKEILLSIFAIGLPPFVMEASGFFLSIIVNKSLEFYGGDIALSGMGAVLSIQMLVMMPIIAISQGAQPIIGYNYGAKKFKRVKETVKITLIAATIVSLIGFFVIFFASTQIMTLFSSKDTEFIKFGSHALRIFLLLLPIVGLQFVGANYFQAVNKPKFAVILALSRQLIILIPAMLILPLFFKLDGLLYAAPLSDFISTIITMTCLFFEIRYLGKNIDNKINLHKIQPVQAD